MGRPGEGVALLTLGLIKVWIHLLGLGTWSPTGRRAPGMGEVVGDRGTEDSQDSGGPSGSLTAKGTLSLS